MCTAYVPFSPFFKHPYSKFPSTPRTLRRQFIKNTPTSSELARIVRQSSQAKRCIIREHTHTSHRRKVKERESLSLCAHEFFAKVGKYKFACVGAMVYSRFIASAKLPKRTSGCGVRLIFG